jgi:hypothetical protein
MILIEGAAAIRAALTEHDYDHSMSSQSSECIND